MASQDLVAVTQNQESAAGTNALLTVIKLGALIVAAAYVLDLWHAHDDEVDEEDADGLPE